MQLICCEYGSSLLTLEADDDIVEELEDEAEPRSKPWRKGPVVSEDNSLPGLWDPLCGRGCQNIPEKLVAHEGDAATNLLAAHCQVDQRVCLPTAAAFL